MNAGGIAKPFTLAASVLHHFQAQIELSIQTDFMNTFKHNQLIIFKTKVLAIAGILSIIMIRSQAQFVEHSTVIYEIEKITKLSDVVINTIENLNIYKESGRLGVFLSQLNKVEVDKIEVETLHQLLSKQAEAIHFKEIILTKEDISQATSQDVFLRRAHNSQYVENFYLIQNQHFFNEEIRQSAFFLQKQIDLFHNIILLLQDAFKNALKSLEDAPIRNDFLEKYIFERFTYYTQKSKDIIKLQESWNLKTKTFEKRYLKFKGDETIRLNNYITLLDDEERLIKSRLIEYEELKKRIAKMEYEARENKKKSMPTRTQLYEQNVRLNQLNDLFNSYKNSITNSNGQIEKKRKTINELNMLEDYQKKRTCPQGYNYKICTAHPTFINDVIYNLNQIQINKNRYSNEISAINSTIISHQSKINEITTQINQVKFAINKFEKELDTYNTKEILITAEIEKLRQILDERSDWAFLNVLKEECTNDKSIIVNRNILN